MCDVHGLYNYVGLLYAFQYDLGDFVVFGRFVYQLFTKRQLLAWSKLKAFADEKINVTEKMEILYRMRKKRLREKEKMLVTSIFSFSHNVFKRLLSQRR